MALKSVNDDSFLALDIGGTNINIGLVSRTGNIIAQNSFPTISGSSPFELIKVMTDNLEIMWKKAGYQRPLALAIGAPGWLKPKEGLVVVAPNIPGWNNIPITELMSKALNMPASLENDANLYALGEWLAGAGRGWDNQITLTLGTGVGGGLILEGRLWNGSFASAAEIGHMPLAADGDICGCGRKGCLETVASATAMTKLAKKWLSDQKETLYKGRPEDINPEIMTALAQKGDPMSLSVFKIAGNALGLVLSSIFNLLSLEAAVIGGGASGAFSFIESGLWESLSSRLVTAQPEEIHVVKGLLGNKAPLVGAAALLVAQGY